MKADSSAIVATAHDAMASEYDSVDDPWYTHLFATIHAELLRAVRGSDRSAGSRALDVGCGTGLQTLLLADAGFDVDGFDLSEGLLDVARGKAAQARAWDPANAFERHMGAAHSEAIRLRGPRARGQVRLFRGDAGDARCFHGGPYDLVNCVGSVLSFVGDPDAVLHQMREACSPRGTIVLECEMKANLDLMWPLVDRMVGGRLHYGLTWREALANMLTVGPRDVETVYPFELKSGEEVDLPMRLFSHRRMAKRLAAAGLDIVHARAVHCVTNAIPSTVLHNRLGVRMSKIYGVLERADRALGELWPFRRLGCSCVYTLRRV
jgi:SAM-dependent methyltransferase